jgi:hypothetical protein
MRNNQPNQPNQPNPTASEVAEMAVDALASMVRLKMSCPDALPKIVASLPQPRNPQAASALLKLVSVAAKFDIGQLARSAEFEAWTDEGDVEDESHADRNGWASHCLARHWAGDWGEVDDEDKQANNDALKHGTRLLSAYTHENTGERIWIITEANRKMTTFLFPHEY